MKKLTRNFWLIAITLCGVCLLGVSKELITSHVQSVQDVQEISVPLLAEVADLEMRSAVLKEQVELVELQSALRIGSHEERMHVYVLPTEFDLDRIVALFDVITLALEGKDYVSNVSGIEMGEEYKVREGAYAIPVSMSLAVQEEGLNEILNLFRIAGLITIADALNEEELDLLFARTEEENPAGVVALEKFLSTDLLEYALEPRPINQRLQRSFTGHAFMSALNSIMKESLLSDAREILGDHFGQVLKQQNLWPMPFIVFDEVITQPGGTEGWDKVSVKLLVHRRGE